MKNKIEWEVCSKIMPIYDSEGNKIGEWQFQVRNLAPGFYVEAGIKTKLIR